MAEATPYNLDAVRADGFVDFYELLGTPQGASEAELRDRIQLLYSEAQANRDHRNLNKRRDYQSLLEYLPQARTALLDADKRATYDAYAAQAQAGSVPGSFSNLMAELSGAPVGDDRTDVLGVQDGRGGGTTNTSSSSTRATTAGSNTSGDTPRRQPQVKSNAQAGLMASAMSVIVFAVLTLIVGLVLKNWPVAILIGAIAAVVVWFIARPKGGTPVGR